MSCQRIQVFASTIYRPFTNTETSPCCLTLIGFFLDPGHWRQECHLKTRQLFMTSFNLPPLSRKEYSRRMTVPGLVIGTSRHLGVRVYKRTYLKDLYAFHIKHLRNLKERNVKAFSSNYYHVEVNKKNSVGNVDLIRFHLHYE